MPDTMKKQITVDAESLHMVLRALNGPGHCIRELQATRGPLFDNPIDKLITQYNEWAAAERAKDEAHHG